MDIDNYSQNSFEFKQEGESEFKEDKEFGISGTQIEIIGEEPCDLNTTNTSQLQFEPNKADE